MAKKVVQDLVSNKRSIRDISLPSRRKQTSFAESESREEPVSIRKNISRPGMRDVDLPIKKTREVLVDDEVDSFEPQQKTDYNFEYDVDHPVKKSKWGIVALGAVFFLALIFGVVSMFASAKLSIIPKTQKIPLQLTLVAPKDQPTGQFGYQIVSVSKSVQKEVVAGADAQSDTKSSGTIIVYNNSNTVQNLIATTRFQTSAGLVYRITKPVTVPKATVVSGKSVPGSAPADVVADQSGDSYNIGLSDFTLPGLKGTPRYSEVYARSKTPMTGGFSGIRKMVDKTVLADATTELQTALKADLTSQIGAQLPQNFVLFPTSISYVYSDVTQQKSTDVNSPKVTLVLSGTASAVIFDRVILSQKVIAAVASTTSIDDQVEISNINDLHLTLVQPTTLTKDYTGPLSFQLSGDAHVVWLFDQAVLKSDLTGMKKDNLNALLQAKYPSIIQAQAKIFPIWKGSFPSDPDKITISLVDSIQ